MAKGRRPRSPPPRNRRLTPRCSGLASLAAELDILRARIELGHFNVVEPSVSIAVLAEHLFAVAEDLRPYQTVELRDAAGKRTALYSRYLVADGSNWARHGLYQQFYSSGSLAAEGTFEHDLEHGPWRGLHENGRLAAQGLYYRGQQAGKWRYWSPDGQEEASELFSEPPSQLTEN